MISCASIYCFRLLKLRPKKCNNLIALFLGKDTITPNDEYIRMKLHAISVYV